MRPLNDITIYCDAETESFTEFRLEANYLCDMYHNRLNGYKPPKTGRICLHLNNTGLFEKPNYFGAICSFGTKFDLHKYRAIPDKLDRYKFLLDLIHGTILEMADFLNWDKDVFIKSYDSIIRDSFKFVKELPTKTSRNRKIVAQVIIEKTEIKTILRLRLINDESLETELITKRNWFWYDSVYRLADKMKWIDNESFGYKSTTTGNEIYYSLSRKSVVKNFDYTDGDF